MTEIQDTIEIWFHSNFNQQLSMFSGSFFIQWYKSSHSPRIWAELASNDFCIPIHLTSL